jgi:serine/threonine-protein kinase RsbW
MAGWHVALQTSLHFEIGSDLCALRDVQKRILDQVCSCHYDPEAAFAIQLALEEAIINAIKHGNRCDPKKKVRIEAAVTPQQTQIIVEDEGTGFCRSAVPDPTADENLERLHGRGILLIESYMDEVEWLDGGRRLKMVKWNPAGEAR